MRYVVALAIALLLSLPSAMTSQPPGPTPGSNDTTVQQLKTRWVKLRRELRNREMLQKILTQKPDANVRFLATQYGIMRSPEFQIWTADSLKLEIKNTRQELMLRNVIFRSNELKEIYLNPPAEQNPDNPHVDDADVLDVATAVVAIVEKEALTRNNDTGIWHLETVPFHTLPSNFGELCDFERFYDAPIAKVRGTGFLVEDSLVVTAGHVVNGAPTYTEFFESVYFLFDYVMESPDVVKTQFTDDQVFKGIKVMADRQDTQTDWALVKLERNPPGRSQMPYRERDIIRDDENVHVYVIGHPHGLPQKYAGVAPIEDNTFCYNFYTQLDVYKRNSGSPVINENNNVAEGVLTGGFNRYEEHCDCWVETDWSPRIGLAGAMVTRSTVFASFIRWPNSVVFRCQIELGVLMTRTDNVEHCLVSGEELVLPYDSWGIGLIINRDCSLVYRDIEAGEVWEVVSESAGTGAVNLVKLVQACYP